jgi:hypothetical protein
VVVLGLAKFSSNLLSRREDSFFRLKGYQFSYRAGAGAGAFPSRRKSDEFAPKMSVSG